MATIYIANCSRQELDMPISIPEYSKLYYVRISSGRETEIKNLNPIQVEYVVAHLERFGARKRSEVRGKLDKFNSGTIYSLDKPINEDEIVAANEEHLDNAQERSVYQITRSALAADQAMRDKNDKRKRLAREVSVEIEEEHPVKGRKPIKMGLTVSANGDPNANLPIQ
jgi:DNA-binding PadR family transcriptional regulator